ncbi:DUF488 family protein, N3 subclade [Halobaculum sp. P14]|uniref:DUF488 family protein, N3 subclade n=1 Tax=Halobaculum sp. P14 TaxID=3421638 RepID=UPI003EB94522
MSTVRTTYFGGFGSVVEPDHDAVVVGVVRYPQEFVEDVVDRNIPALAPPPTLLDAYKAVEQAAERDEARRPSAIAWDSIDFEQRYREFLTNAGQQQVLGTLRSRLEDDTPVWLVCWEKDATYCHRRLLADVLADSLDVDIVHSPDPSDLERSSAPTPTSLTEFGGESA